MQFKKEEVRNALLSNARIEFLEKGFEKASIRSIVKSAGTTIGNFYNYFKNKEALFEELVDGEYTRFLHFIQHHNDIERPDYLWESFDLEQWRTILKAFINQYIPMFTDNLVLLIESSKGTKYENAKPILISYLEKHFVEHMEEHNASYIKSTAFPSFFARQFLEGIITILKDYKDDEERENLIIEFILFFFIGSMGLLGQ